MATFFGIYVTGSVGLTAQECRYLQRVIIGITVAVDAVALERLGPRRRSRDRGSQIVLR